MKNIAALIVLVLAVGGCQGIPVDSIYEPAKEVTANYQEYLDRSLEEGELDEWEHRVDSRTNRLLWETIYLHKHGELPDDLGDVDREEQNEHN